MPWSIIHFQHEEAETTAVGVFSERAAGALRAAGFEDDPEPGLMFLPAELAPHRHHVVSAARALLRAARITNYARPSLSFAETLNAMRGTRSLTDLTTLARHCLDTNGSAATMADVLHERLTRLAPSTDHTRLADLARSARQLEHQLDDYVEYVQTKTSTAGATPSPSVPQPPQPNQPPAPPRR
ncbi:hypothetical protein [Streptomyces sedi]|uniref:Uncharacterized protein n=1 Tax=Streptomyces sedi TaxID=555059 RepID=A0A5C4ULU5_9ACTN|nr:hypothetical protein [Streptomyces sedi]TNM24580.1 hypothetical protein FH715_27260 [Streptomyces sedi]